MLRAPTLILLLVAAAAVVTASGKDEHVSKRAVQSVERAVRSLSERYADCSGTPLGCKRDTEKHRALDLNMDLFGSAKRALENKDTDDLRSVIKRAKETATKERETRARESLDNLRRDIQKSASVHKVRAATKTLKDSQKRFAELPWKRALGAFGPMGSTLQKKAAMEKVNKAKKQLRNAESPARVSGLLKRTMESLKHKRAFEAKKQLRNADSLSEGSNLVNRALQTLKHKRAFDEKKQIRNADSLSKDSDLLNRALETLKHKRAEEKRASDMFAPLKRALQMKVGEQKESKRKLTEHASQILKRAQEGAKKTRQTSAAKRMFDDFFSPAKRELQKHAARSTLAQATRALKSHQMKDTVKRAVEKLTSKRDEVVGKRMKDVMAPILKMRRDLHEKAAVAKLRSAAETLKRAVRDVAK